MHCCCLYTCDVICVFNLGLWCIKMVIFVFSWLRFERHHRKKDKADKHFCGIITESQLFACRHLSVFYVFLRNLWQKLQSTTYLNVKISPSISSYILLYGFCVKCDTFMVSRSPAFLLPGKNPIQMNNDNV